MKDNKLENARKFCAEVKELAKKNNIPFFVVTDGASAISNNDCFAVKALEIIILKKINSILMKIGVKRQ